MELPLSLRESLVDDLEQFLDAVSDNPSPEAVAAYLIEQLEVYAEDAGYDDLIADLEEEGAVDGTLAETLENEMESNEEFEFTGEEVVSLLDELCEIDWEDDEDDEDVEDVEEEEDF